MADIREYKTLFFNRIRFENIFFIIFAGGLIGVLTAFNPLLENIFHRSVRLTLFDHNVFTIIPYELTILFCFFISFLLFLIVIFKHIKAWLNEILLILFILGIHITSLTRFVKIDLSEMALLALGALLIIRSMVQKEKIIISLLDILNILFIIIMLLSFTNTKMSTLLFYSLTLVKFVLILLVIHNYINSMDKMLFFIKIIVTLTVLSALLGYFQEVVFLKYHFTFTGMIERKTLWMILEYTSYGPMLRVPGFFETYKPYSFYMNTSILILFNYYIYNNDLTIKKKILLIVLICIMLGALMLTFSKDAFLALFIAISLSILVRWRYTFIYMVLFVLFLLTIITITQKWDNLYSEFYDTIHFGEPRIRLQLARDGIHGFFNRHPLIGIGLDSTHLYTRNYNGWAAHNVFIEAANAVGVVGLSIFMLLLFYSLFQFIKACITAESKTEKWISMGLFTAFLSYLIAIQFHPFFYEKLTWIFMALINSYMMIKSKSTIPQKDIIM